MKNTILTCVLLILLPFGLHAQDDLMDLFGEEESQTVDYAYATFKTTRGINGHSVENPAEGVLLFLIQHRFGRLNTGAYEFFGLDQASIRLGFEYGISERLAVGVGRSSLQKTFDGFVKYRILRQSSGARKMPVTISYYGSVALTSLTWKDLGVEDRTNYFSSRMAFTHQLLIARKFSNAFSLQLTPGLIHKNLVPAKEDANDILTIGITDYAQSELGDIVFVEAPDVGEAVKSHEAFGTIEAVKTVEDLIAPVSGEVVEVNEALGDHPELINSDPYGAGWMIRIRIEAPGELEGLLSASEYGELLAGQ